MQNFDVNKLSGEEAKAIVRNLLTPFQANIQRQQVSSEKIIEELVIDLSVERTRANAIKISFPFVSLRVEQATDIQTFCNLIPVDVSEYQKSVQVKLNDSLEFDNGISGLFITHPAQAGKKMVLKFFTQGRVRSGSVVLDQGSVPVTITLGSATAINDGFTFPTESPLFGMPNANNSVVNTNSTFAINNQIFNNGSYISPFGLSSTEFKVPMGYTAEILSMSVLCTVAIPSADWGFNFLELDEGSNYGTMAALINSNKSACSSTMRPLTPSPIPYVFNVKADPFGSITPRSPRPRNRIFDQGKLIVPMITNEFLGSNGGNLSYSLLIRLTKKVEV